MEPTDIVGGRCVLRCGVEYERGALMAKRRRKVMRDPTVQLELLRKP